MKVGFGVNWLICLWQTYFHPCLSTSHVFLPGWSSYRGNVQSHEHDHLRRRTQLVKHSTPYSHVSIILFVTWQFMCWPKAIFSLQLIVMIGCTVWRTWAGSLTKMMTDGHFVNTSFWIPYTMLWFFYLQAEKNPEPNRSINTRQMWSWSHMLCTQRCCQAWPSQTEKSQMAGVCKIPQGIQLWGWYSPHFSVSWSTIKRCVKNRSYFSISTF